jgi:dTDP-4-dehydrorhamnose reductase
MDLLDGAAVRALIERRKPAAIIHAAAANPGASDSYEVNVAGSANIAEAAVAAGCRLVHVSSDMVFSGAGAPYADDAQPDPINNYGRSKAEGEQVVLNACPAAAVVRTSLIYGIDEMDRGTSGFAAQLGRGDELSLWDDALRQPVWIDALCAALQTLALVETGITGTLNVAGEQTLSRAAFGRRLLEHWGVDTTRVRSGSAADVPGQPLDLTLTFGRARQLGLSLVGVDDVLAGSADALTER